MTNITFSSLFTQILNASNMNLREAHALLADKDVNVPYSSLSAYKTFAAVPTYDRALNMLRAFEYKISNDELIEILAYSKSQLSNLRDDTRQYFNKGVRINPENISEGLSSEELARMIEQRIADLSESNFNTYIAKLIKDDLYNCGIFTGEYNV